MDKKEFIFPGIIIGLVLIIAVGLLLTQKTPALPFSSSGFATSTATSSPDTQNPSIPGLGDASTPPASGPKAQYYPYGETQLALNAVAGFKDGLSIRPVELLEDSRCPAGVYCIQAGTVRIVLKTSTGGVSATHTLALGDQITVNGDLVTFDSVQPLRLQGAQQSPNSYTFGFTVLPKASGNTTQKPCFVGGCSSELCSDTEAQVSSCLYRSEYACYAKATCERQKDGMCGWTQTPELRQCLSGFVR